MLHPNLEKLYTAMNAFKLDSIAINPGPTLAYLTGLGFHLSERPVIIFFTPGKDPAIILPDLETPKLKQSPFAMQAFPYSETPSEWSKAFEKGVQAHGIKDKSIGVEPRALRILEYRFIEQAAPGASFPDASEALASLRIRKNSNTK
jgi:Xaa-Pro dipeptidase